MKYDREYELVCKLENTHSHRSSVVNAAIAILKEVIGNVDEDGYLPPYCRDYLTEKIDTIYGAIKWPQEAKL